MDEPRFKYSTTPLLQLLVELLVVIRFGIPWVITVGSLVYLVPKDPLWWSVVGFSLAWMLVEVPRWTRIDKNRFGPDAEVDEDKTGIVAWDKRGCFRIHFADTTGCEYKRVVSPLEFLLLIANLSALPIHVLKITYPDHKKRYLNIDPRSLSDDIPIEIKKSKTNNPRQ